MSWLHALILGLVQGCTEFFPVSSSAHLQLVKTWLDLPAGEETLLFDLACHLGTLVALMVYFRKELKDICFQQPRKMVLYLIALFPLIPAYFILKSFRAWVSETPFLGLFLLITALMLFASRKLSKRDFHPIHWKDALWIGALQSAALVPGISRSASTITAGIHRGLAIPEAVRFSFLLSIPTVAGGICIELIAITKQASITLDGAVCSIGLIVSALVGMVVVRWAIPLLEKGLFRPFAWYCLIVAILLTLY